MVHVLVDRKVTAFPLPVHEAMCVTGGRARLGRGGGAGASPVQHGQLQSSFSRAFPVQTGRMLTACCDAVHVWGTGSIFASSPAQLVDHTASI